MVKYIVLILILICSLVSFDYGKKKSEKEFLTFKLNLQTELNTQLTKVRELEQQLVINQTKSKLDKEREIKTITSRYTTIISGLQQRPERTISSTTNENPPITAAIPPRAGSTGEQLFREDAEFLIREAAKAEVLKQALLACRRDYASIVKE